MIAVVVALREHLHLLASVPGVGGVVEDEHPVFLLLREMVKEFVDDPRRDDYKTGAFLSVFSSLCNGFSVFKVLRKSNL
jgi:hypothetical protein